MFLFGKLIAMLIVMMMMMMMMMNYVVLVKRGRAYKQ
jgi:hypothetical protein